jgi:cytochrome d ubiquinol oxidase subunit II
MSPYQVIWYFLVGILLTGFAVLDGFDLGVGIWYLRSRGDKERRTLLNAIGPVWDGNEVWLLTAGGALFAAFPPVYGTVFSGFYLAIMLLLAALIFRAVSMEFRSKETSKRWRSSWDKVFSVSSILAAILFGVAFGNILRGIPLSEAGHYTGGFFGLLNPYALMVGVFTLTALAFHGAVFANLKSTGELSERARGWGALAGPAYLAMALITAGITIAYQPHLLENYANVPLLYALPLLAIACIVLAIVHLKKAREGKAFAFSALSIIGLMATAGAGLFPRMVPNLSDMGRSLTAANSSSSPLTLKTMLVLAIIGVPIVLAYTIWVYRAFAGKVDVEHESSHY